MTTEIQSLIKRKKLEDLVNLSKFCARAEDVLLENNDEIISSNEQYVTYMLKTNDVSYDNVFDQFFSEETINACHIKRNITPH